MGVKLAVMGVLPHDGVVRAVYVLKRSTLDGIPVFKAGSKETDPLRLTRGF